MTEVPSVDLYSLTGILCMIVALVLFVIAVWTSRDV
jgi:hypothetical protein